MKINSKDFRVQEGQEVDLKKWPTKVDPVYKSKEQYKKLLDEHVAHLSSQQQLLYASNRYAVLLIFQAMDAAGKDGAISHVMSGVNPQGCQVFSFKHPSAVELEHDFLWRTTRDLPERGRIGIFNRSYYEEVLIVRVHPEILRKRSDSRTRRITRRRSGTTAIVRSRIWRRHLHVNGTRIIKFFLHLSKEEQRKRFLARIDEPEKNWKFSAADIAERKFWKQYMKAYEQCLSRDKHPGGALVCRSRRRQGERQADCIADRARYARGTKNVVPQDQRKAPPRIAVDPQAAREMRFCACRP